MLGVPRCEHNADVSIPTGLRITVRTGQEDLLLPIQQDDVKANNTSCKLVLKDPYKKADQAYLKEK